MLYSLRFKATRTIPRYTRTLVNNSAGSDQRTLSNALSAFEDFADPDPLAGTSSLVPPPPTPPSPTTNMDLSQPPDDPSLMIIPPAQDPLLHYLTSKITQNGLRTKAAHRVSRVLMHIHGYTRAHPLPILREAIFAASPAVRVVMHKKGAKSVAKPMALNEKQRTRYGVEWILNASEKKAGKSLEVRLAKEMVAVVQGTSEALKKKEEVHRFAMLNRGNVPSPRI